MTVNELWGRRGFATRFGVGLLVVLMAMVIVTPSRAEAQGPFEDVTGGVHAPAIEALTYAGIIAGTECSNDKFCPDEPFERWTMAVWMVRALGEQSSTTPVQYRDVSNRSWWAPYVQRLSELGITKGCTDTRYCPHDTVTRAQMATFLVRAFDPDPAGGVATSPMSTN